MKDCGADCSQYVSTHLPMYIIQHEKFNNESDLEFNNLLTESFQAINKRFSEKAQREVFFFLFYKNYFNKI